MLPAVQRSYQRAGRGGYACSTDLDVQLHATDRQEYRNALHDAIRGLEAATLALVVEIERPRRNLLVSPITRKLTARPNPT
jgi:hypothetical protein